MTHIIQNNNFLTQYECQNVCSNITNSTKIYGQYITNIVINTGDGSTLPLAEPFRNHFKTRRNFSKYIVFDKKLASWHEARTYCQNTLGTKPPENGKLSFLPSFGRIHPGAEENQSTYPPVVPGCQESHHEQPGRLHHGF